MLNIKQFNNLLGLSLILSIFISPSNAYTKSYNPRGGYYCDEGYCCVRKKCIQKILYDSKANVLFALDNSYSMLKNDRLIKLNDGFSNMADYIPAVHLVDALNVLLVNV